jgi:hypothetical protein
MKKYLLASLAVFATFMVLDIIIHGQLLQGAYMASASLWRPEGEMMMGLMTLVTVVTSLTFTAIYAFLVKGGSVATGAKFGLLYGLGAGFAMGMGNYSMMPIPTNIAWAWFISYAFEATVAGAVAGWIVKKS